MNASSHAKNARVAKNCTKENNGFGLWFLPALLCDLSVLCVMHAESHAKSAKGAKNCIDENNWF
jgi:hypothetical protein